MCLTKRMKNDLEWTETEARSVLYLVGIPKDLADAALLGVYHREEILAEIAKAQESRTACLPA